MADTFFQNGTVIEAEWLNDVNDFVYKGGATTSIFKYFTQAEIDDVVARTQVYDLTLKIQEAIDDIGSAGGTLYFPVGTYKITSSLIIPYNWYDIRLTGAGSASQFSMSGATSFNLISFTDPGTNVVGFNRFEIDHLMLNGNSLPGSGNLIDTTGLSNVHAHDLTMIQLPVDGSGVFVNGNGTTYNHDTICRDITFDTNTGFAFINFSSTSADGLFSRIYGDGRFVCDYGFYFAAGASNHIISDCHIYNHSKNVVAITSNGDTLQFSNCLFDYALEDIVRLESTVQCVFTNCKFMFAPAGFSNLLLNNSSSNKFVNTTLEGNTGGLYALREIGSSNDNIFSVLTVQGTFASSPALTIVGTRTAVKYTGSAIICNAVGSGLVAATTTYGGYGVMAAEASVQVVVPSNGFLRTLRIIGTVAPGVGQTFIGTVRINNTDTAIVATVSGAGFTATATGLIPVSENDSISIRIVTSAGAATSTIRASLTIDL